MSLRKSIERAGKRLLIGALVWLLGVRPRPVELTFGPRILLVRLDERVGNVILLTPLLQSLRLRFAAAQIDLLGSVRGEPLLKGHPALNRFLPFRKRALFAKEGPIWAPFRLRRGRYDLAIDATNPTDPSVTQAILVRLSGARHTLGFDSPSVARLFSARAHSDGGATHEIDSRLQLLSVLPGDASTRQTSIAPLPVPTPGSPLSRLIACAETRPLGVVNVGARLVDKRLGAVEYRRLVELVSKAGLLPVVTYGPRERELAVEVAKSCRGAKMAPPTNLLDLGNLMASARAVVTCDTGPMHLAVAMKTPTCGLFVNSPLERYGYQESPHRAIDVQQDAPEVWLALVSQWLETLGQRSGPM